MKTTDLTQFNLIPLNIAEDRQISTGFAGDLLSIVISKAPTNAVWFTVMNNVNVIAVATLSDVSAVVICDADISEDLISKAKENNVNLFKSNFDVYGQIV